MGYGHLRAAWSLADALGTTVTEVDRPPVAGPEEGRQWERARRLYEGTSRWSQLPVVGAPFQRVLDAVTAIDHLHPYRDLSRPTAAVRAVDRQLRSGLGRGLAMHLHATGATLVATYLTPALAADLHDCPRVACVVTDADISRAWVPLDPRRSRIRYLAPSTRSVRRLLSYGVPRDNVQLTGFPLPLELLGGPGLELRSRHLAGRLVRLDPSGLFREPRRREIEHVVGALPAAEEGRPPLLTFAVGGAGAQAELARSFLPSLQPLVSEGKLRVALVAGVRRELAERFQTWLQAAGLPEDGERARVLVAGTFREYYRRFNALLAETDVLWTKPGELTFYGALGIPLVLSRPVGVHESYNRRWARERGAGLKQRDARAAGQWLSEWLEEGVLASAAWSGAMNLPASGTFRIVAAVSSLD